MSKGFLAKAVNTYLKGSIGVPLLFERICRGQAQIPGQGLGEATMVIQIRDGLGLGWESTIIDVLGLGSAGKAKLLISWARAGLLRLKNPIVSFNSEPLVL